MIVFHSSPYIITEPDVAHSRNYLDFGKGFYVTTLREQAVKYAQRFILRGQKAYLNIFDFNEKCQGFAVRRFDSYDGEWLDFVSECRRGTDRTDYDMVIGGIANDKVFRTIDLYFSGDITKDEALSKLKYEQPNDQLCLRSQEIINANLKFIGFEEVR